ncbi:hypothetical protein Gotur_021566 [Gossypium turneri]
MVYFLLVQQINKDLYMLLMLKMGEFCGHMRLVQLFMVECQ